MGERSPEFGQVSPEVRIDVTEGAPDPSLRDRVLAAYPARCQGQGKWYDGVGIVCEKILARVEPLLEDVKTGALSEDYALAQSAEHAGEIQDVCRGPRNFVTTGSLKCGVDYSNFHDINKPPEMRRKTNPTA